MIEGDAPSPALALQELSPLQQKLGYTFTREELLHRALTHPSATQQSLEGQFMHNQRLEFLGDAVLSLLLAEKLFEELPDEREGVLSQQRSALAQGAQLAQLACELKLPNYLYLSPSVDSHGGRDKPSILEDALEAVVGAIYLDSQRNLDVTREVVLSWYGNLQERLEPLIDDHNPKGRLQEIVQPNWGNQAIRYDITDISGPQHDLIYTCTVYICEHPCGTGQGSSKKAAQEQAARAALKTWPGTEAALTKPNEDTCTEEQA